MIRNLIFAVLIAFPLSLSADERPNIIIIMADDLGYGDLSPYRKGAPRTPSAQRLADEGMLFTDAHSPSAVCTPTRYSLLTGRYAWRSYLQDWVLSERMPLLIEEGIETLPAMMQNAGYKTGCVGKWHLGFGREMDAYQNNDFSIGPNTVGFDYFFGVPFSHNSTPEMEVFMENDRIIGLPEEHTVWDPIGLTAARRSLENTAGDLSSAAVHFIRENRDRTFFLYYPTTNVHFPITPHAAFKMGKRGDDFEGLYDGFVAEFDWAIGQVLRTLEDLNLVENTIIMVTSDNGGLPKFGGNNEPWFGDKTQIYEGGHRVPLLVRWPGVVEAGSVCDEPVVLLDLHATCAEIIGTTLDLGVAEDSVSWMPLLDADNEREFTRRPIVHHSVQGLFAIRDGDWKLVDGVGSGAGRFEIGLKDAEAVVIRNEDGSYEPFSFQPILPEAKPDEPRGQLFHLGKNPREQINLYREHPEEVERLRGLLEEIKAADSSLWR
ncbi:MAG: arylsulfatase [Verrucomicrobiales bacterium]|nr:arylsulfatase [Verrucomicrobiales bacterium]